MKLEIDLPDFKDKVDINITITRDGVQKCTSIPSVSTKGTIIESKTPDPTSIRSDEKHGMNYADRVSSVQVSSIPPTMTMNF